MARTPKLKVFRTPIGFHDAYVAAPSQKAALEAWGSDANLFARGIAEQVEDPGLTEAPLARPGEVVKVLRGTTAEQLAALPDAPVPTPARPKRRSAMSPPSRAALDAAERALADAEAAHAAEDRRLADEEARINAERRVHARTAETERTRLEAARDRVRRQYEAALARWRG